MPLNFSTATEARQAADEELHGANEGLLSDSEEMKRLKEELLASQEKMRSANEEFNRVNQELLHRNEQLAKARDYSEAIFDTIRDPLLILDSELRVRSASKGFYEKFNLEEVEGSFMYQLPAQPWQDPELAERLRDLIIRKIPLNDYEITCELPNAGKCVLLVNARKMESMDGEILVLVSFEDVVISRQETDELIRSNRELEERVKMAVEATGIGIWEIELGNEKLITDEQIRLLFGFKADDQPSYDDFKKAVHQDDIGRRNRQLNAAIAGKNGGRYHIEYRIYLRDTGEMRWLNSSGQVFFNEHQKASRIVGTMIDITTQKMAEQLLKESEARFRLAADTAAAMIWMSGTDDKCNYFNKSWLQFRGRNLEEEVGDGWKDGVFPEDYNRCIQFYLDSIRAREDFYVEYRLKRQDGEYRWISDTGVPRFSPEGLFEGFVGTCMDIHDQKMATEELERVVADRTSLLHEAISNLKMSNQNLEEFAYVASHDLQEPLRKIKTFAELLESRTGIITDEATALYISKIKKASDRMSRLIEDLLNYSQLKKEEEPVLTDLNQVLQNVLGDFDLSIHQKKAGLRMDKLPVILAIPIHANQLFHNLVSNALKFSKDGPGLTIDISCRTVEAQERQQFPGLNKKLNYSHITFSDNGIGFEGKYAEKVFDIFHRLNGRSQYEGTGIGLAVCRKIVNNMQGVIFAESEEGVGTSFHILLPTH